MSTTGYFPKALTLAVITVSSILVVSQQHAFAQDASAEGTFRHEAHELGIRIGSAVNVFALSTDVTYAQILGEQFSAITPENEMKWASVEAVQGVLNFTAADSEVLFAQQHGQRVRGHNLVWHNQLPNWLTTGVANGTISDAELAVLLQQHIFAEAGHFAGEIWQWDVVNEPLAEDGTLLHSIWLTHLGTNYIADALTWAHQADPKAKLYLNDFNIEGLGPKSDGMYALVKNLLEQHVPIDGVGFETHLGLQFGLPSMIRQNLQRFADLGLEVSITEMDARMILPATPALLAEQASVYSQVMQDCIAVRRCVDFTVWEYTDKYSWIPGFFKGQGAADLYDQNFNPKPAAAALVDALENPVSHKRHHGR
jgi:endo-1,4-beta-xylanase